MTAATVRGDSGPRGTGAASGGRPDEPTDRRRRRPARTRASIEEAALKLFTEQGFDATTVEQIAEAADVAPRTFFRHFPSKDAVLFGDTTHETERMRQVLHSRPVGEHPMRSLTAVLLDTAERVELDRQQHLLRARLLESLEATGDYEFHMLHRRWVHDVVDELIQHCDAADGADPRLYTWAIVLMSCFGSAMRTWLARTDGAPLREVFTALLDETASGLGGAAELAGG
ncbi:MAG: TetR family transcriptional regulator [Saccharopolyspora sp.]|uniref:TetR family transcriptional regulator n=1 Tax=Saccharopolyspora sp. TaxID=33915 RepID=UPI0025D87893|nr:TetR family transcriptional regulator [Saccharopolyspora sp.]MBQ6641855.1 TetR family transcriptional regulator [Saccharopolyspora sp.]